MAGFVITLIALIFAIAIVIFSIHKTEIWDEIIKRLK